MQEKRPAQNSTQNSGQNSERRETVTGRKLYRLGCFVFGITVIASFGLVGNALASAGSSALEDVRLAYLDPGSGSFLVQALIAMFAGIVVTLRLYWAKIANLLGLGGTDRDDDYYEDEDDDDRMNGDHPGQ